MLSFASSMSIYGEGRYRAVDGTERDDVERPTQGSKYGWDPVDAADQPLIPIPTPEEKKGALASVYAIGKFVQERLTLTLTPAVRHAGHCPPPMERLRARTGLVQPLYRRAGDLRLSYRQRAPADDFRGRAAAARFRARLGRRTSLPPGA